MFVNTGVRPLLQEFMLIIPKDERTFFDALHCRMTPPGNAHIKEWLSVLEYCLRMRENDDGYALAVMKEARCTLSCGRLMIDGVECTRGYCDGSRAVR